MGGKHEHELSCFVQMKQNYQLMLTHKVSFHCVYMYVDGRPDESFIGFEWCSC